MDENIGFYQKRRQSADQEIAAFMEKYRQYAVSYCYLCCRYSGFRSWADMGRHEEKNDRGRKLLLNIVSLDGCLIGELTGLSMQTTSIFLTDPLGSVIATFSNTAGSAALSGNQAYGPYGHLRYNAGGLVGMGTSKGFTGQYADAFSGLDYYNARSYQPAVGVFLSADSKEGNQQGMDPCMYVGGNPQTYNDPTGQFYAPPPQGNGSPPPNCEQGNLLV